jgi:hypothetical protein
MAPWVRISEYGRRYRLSPDTLRRWETEGVALPIRYTPAGQRQYDAAIPPGRRRYDRSRAALRRLPVFRHSTHCGDAQTSEPQSAGPLVLTGPVLNALPALGYGVDNLIRGEVPAHIVAMLKRL